MSQMLNFAIQLSPAKVDRGALPTIFFGYTSTFLEFLHCRGVHVPIRCQIHLVAIVTSTVCRIPIARKKPPTAHPSESVLDYDRRNYYYSILFHFFLGKVVMTNAQCRGEDTKHEKGLSRRLVLDVIVDRIGQ
jgi:hypothetical protein